MKTLDLNKIHILASEWDCEEPINRIYVVAKTADGEYDDPMTCVVELDQDRVFTAVPFHQFLKFNCPVPLEIPDDRLKVLMRQLLLLPVRYQRLLIWLYDPDSIETPEEIVKSDMFDHIKMNLLIPLSKEEFNSIETGFRLYFKYPMSQEIRDYKSSVKQYLTSMEIIINQKKVDRVVELILEYLEGIGQWQRDYPF